MSPKIFVSAILITATVHATTIEIRPDESTSKDTFIYQGNVGPSAFNGETFNGFQQFLSSGATGTGHDTRTYIQFDQLATSGISASDVVSATLHLHTEDTLQSGFGASPSATFPVQADIYQVTGNWTETGVTFPNQPSLAGSILAFSPINAIGVDVPFDVTLIVKSWLNGAATNDGLAVLQHDLVLDTDNGQKVVALYDSASAITVANRPYLSITLLPEPTLLGAAVLGAMFLRRRRS